MSDAVRITGMPDNSAKRVALELMDKIRAVEDLPSDKSTRREYYLTLYRQCLLVVDYGKNAAEAIAETTGEQSPRRNLSVY